MAETPDTPEKMVQRKNDHIDLCLSRDVESTGENFAADRLLPEAAPPFGLDDVNTSQKFLGHAFKRPLLITGMTGGVEKGQFINEVLALAAQEWGIPMGLGSQKMMLARSEFRPLFDVKKVAPQAFVIGNLGLASFNYGVKHSDVKRLVDELQLDAFAFHLNALQECIQPEGETRFHGLLTHLERACAELPVPVVVKEVGSGMTGETVRRLAEAGAVAVDVGGRSGTSWSAIEGMRGNSLEARLGELFRNWGWTTRQSLLDAAAVVGTLETKPELIATGGIRDGLQVAKAVARGAHMAGVGLPLFRAVMTHPEDREAALQSLQGELEFFDRGLRIAMFASGCLDLTHLAARVRPLSTENMR